MDGFCIKEVDTESNFDPKDNNDNSNLISQNIETVLRLRDESDVSLEDRNQWVIDHKTNTIEYPLK